MMENSVPCCLMKNIDGGLKMQYVLLGMFAGVVAITVAETVIGELA